MDKEQKILDSKYWNRHWKNKQTGWDIGYASPPISDYMLKYPNKDAIILIPGCGNAYEAEFLAGQGFKNIHLLDFAPRAVRILEEKYAEIDGITVHCEDFFKFDGEFDLILEQTFFCAQSPSRRSEYAEKTASLLKDNGKLTGVLFKVEFEKDGPPFGGSVDEYTEIFDPFFEILKMEDCYNSIKPRAGVEVFIEFEKK